MASILKSTPVLCLSSFILGIAVCIGIDLILLDTNSHAFMSLLFLRIATWRSRSTSRYEEPHHMDLNRGDNIHIKHDLCLDTAANLTISCQSVAYQSLLGQFLPDWKDIYENKPETFMQSWKSMENDKRFAMPPFGTYYEYFDIQGTKGPDIEALLVHTSPKLTKKKLFSDGIIIHIHGGGYVVGSFKADHQYMSYLHLFTGLPVLGFDYRLAPQSPLQSGALLEDSEAVIMNYLNKHLSVPYNKMYVTGISAGGGASLIVMHQFARKGKFFGGVIPISAWTDLRCLKDVESYTKFDGIDPILDYNAMLLFQMYALGCRDIDGNLTSNNFDKCISNGLNELNTKEMNPATDSWKIWSKQQNGSNKMNLLFIASEYEILRDDTINVYNKAIELGLKDSSTLLIMKSRVHGLPLFVDIPEAMAWIAKIASYINKWNNNI